MKIMIEKILLSLATPFFVVSCNGEKSNDNKSNPDELAMFISQIKSDLVFVPGGEFMMGDFGEKEFGSQIDPNPDSKPLHKVVLTSFNISKFKITNENYHFYLNYNHLPGREVKKSLERMWGDMNKTPKSPANLDWNEASSYCTWLSKMTQLPFHLPTEAQWEYAARSRGSFAIQATNDGKIDIRYPGDGKDIGINIPTDYDRHKFSLENGTHLDIISSMPVDAYPPNSLGVFDMTANGFEWVNDWYDPDYYQKSPQDNPTGPVSPIFKDEYGQYAKVVRSLDQINGISGSVVERRYNDPALTHDDFPGGYTARCVVNTPETIK